MKSKFPLHWQILIGLGLGIGYGAFVSVFTEGDVESWEDFNSFTKDWIKPFGTVFVNCLKLIAVPLVLFSLVSGITNLKSVAQLGDMGGKAIAFYLATTVVAIVIGLTVVNVFKPWDGIDKEASERIIASFAEEASGNIENAEKVKQGGPLQFMIDVFPENIIEASSVNSNMLQVITFSILFGIALLSIPTDKGQPVKLLFDGINEVVLKMVDFIMLLAPIGTFALIAFVFVSNSRDFVELLAVIGKYFGSVLVALILLVAGVYPLVLWFLTKVNPVNFFKDIAPAQLLAFSTSSSAAALPVTMECVHEKVGVDEEVTSFILPLGATINMDGTSCYQAVAAVFIANIMGHDLTFMDQASIVVTATLASIGSAAVPGAGMVMLAIVLGHLGIAMEGIALILGVDRILDMCRTVVNVTGDATIATVIGKRTGKLKTK